MEGGGNDPWPLWPSMMSWVGGGRLIQRLTQNSHLQWLERLMIDASVKVPHLKKVHHNRIIFPIKRRSCSACGNENIDHSASGQARRRIRIPARPTTHTHNPHSAMADVIHEWMNSWLKSWWILSYLTIVFIELGYKKIGLFEWLKSFFNLDQCIPRFCPQKSEAAQRAHTGTISLHLPR